MSFPTPQQATSPFLGALRLLIVRLRFFLVLLSVLLLVGYWPVLRNYLERITQSSRPNEGAISVDTEYWCPMCPGVVSDWPSKCPVCNMTLVRRKKGEPVPLPDGVLARMQFSPYRVQLAGIQTTTVEYRALRRPVTLIGKVQRSQGSTAVEVRAEAFADDWPFLKVGQTVEAAADGLDGHVPFRGEITRIDPSSDPAQRAIIVQVHIDDPQGELHSGNLARLCADAPLTQLPWWRQSVLAEWRNQTTIELTTHALLGPALPAASAGARSLLEGAVRQGMLAEGMGLSIPYTAVIDHGSRKVAFVESAPGMFDATEVVVGPRCGDFYPVLRGLGQAQRVAATGAFLLDAEMWLNRSLASTWFGATRGGDSAASNPATTPSTPVIPPGSTQQEDRLLAAKQKICPVTGEPLDSMGGPVRVEVAGRVVFVCCKGCIDPLRKDAAKYLENLK